MIKKTETYTDFNGVERTEDFMFHFSKAELAEMELTTKGGFNNYVQKIIDSKDQGAIILVFKDLLLKAYGEKSDDGRFFRKSPELSKNFSESPVYSKLFMLFATDDLAASDFINGVIPVDAVAK